MHGSGCGSGSHPKLSELRYNAHLGRGLDLVVLTLGLVAAFTAEGRLVLGPAALERKKYTPPAPVSEPWGGGGVNSLIHGCEAASICVLFSRAGARGREGAEAKSATKPHPSRTKQGYRTTRVWARELDIHRPLRLTAAAVGERETRRQQAPSSRMRACPVPTLARPKFLVGSLVSTPTHLPSPSLRWGMGGIRIEELRIGIYSALPS